MTKTYAKSKYALRSHNNRKRGVSGVDSSGQPIPQLGFHFDPKEHRYYLDSREMTGVTTILGVISKPALIQWAANEACKYIKDNSDFDGRYTVLEETLEKARTAHARIRNKAADQGTDLHGLVEEYVRLCTKDTYGQPLSGRAIPVSEDGKFAPIKKFVDWAFANEIKFIATEQKLYSRTLFVAGTCDLVFEKDGKTYVGDVKTYAKIWDRTPFFQCAGYSIMWEETEAFMDPIRGTNQVRHVMNRPIDGYCVLRLGKDGSFEDLWSFDVEGDREAFRAAVTLYRKLENFNK